MPDFIVLRVVSRAAQRFLRCLAGLAGVVSAALQRNPQ